jgi:uncharacterized membrane protein YqiK
MEPILVSAGIAIVLLFCFIVMFAKFYRKIEQGHALIINTLRAEPEDGDFRQNDRDRSFGQ